MSEIAIIADTKSTRFAQCRSCGARIQWAETVNGKRIPFDGEIVVLRSQGSPLEGRTIEYVDAKQNHFVTCPHREQWKREHL
jgi:hypothetical protein